MVKPTHLQNSAQIGSFPQVLGLNIEKSLWNHHQIWISRAIVIPWLARKDDTTCIPRESLTFSTLKNDEFSKRNHISFSRSQNFSECHVQFLGVVYCHVNHESWPLSNHPWPLACPIRNCRIFGAVYKTPSASISESTNLPEPPIGPGPPPTSNPPEIPRFFSHRRPCPVWADVFTTANWLAVAKDFTSSWAPLHLLCWLRPGIFLESMGTLRVTAGPKANCWGLPGKLAGL